MKILSLLGKKKDSVSKARMWAYTDGPFEFQIRLFCSENYEMSYELIKSEISSHHHTELICPFCDNKFKVAAVDYMFASDEEFVKRPKSTHILAAVNPITVLVDKMVEQFWEMG